VQEHLYANPPYSYYGLNFTPCKELTFRLGHLKTLVPEICAALDQPDKCFDFVVGRINRRNCMGNKDPEIAIRIKAGEKIGTTGGMPGQNMLDLTAYDRRSQPLVFAGKDRFYPDCAYTVCPLDYYGEPRKGEWKALLGNYNGSIRRTIKPICGIIQYDLAGTALGKWFISEDRSKGPEDPHLSLIYDNVDPNLAVFSIGISFVKNLPSAKYTFSPVKSGFVNRDLIDIQADGEIFSFEKLRGQAGNRILYLQLMDDTHLKVEARQVSGCGAGPWQFGEKAFVFLR
jgi:hypothetical protein